MAQRVLSVLSGQISLVDNQGSDGLSANYNIETLTGTPKVLTSASETFQYLTVTSATVLDLPLPTNADEKIFYIFNFGNRRLDIFVDGVDTGFNLRPNRVYLVHSAVVWNLVRLA